MHRSKPDARTRDDTVAVVTSQRLVEAPAGPVRLASHLKEAGGDDTKATELYLWAGDLAGALHSRVAIVEVVVGNALDAQLASETWRRSAIAVGTGRRAPAPHRCCTS